MGSHRPSGYIQSAVTAKKICFRFDVDTHKCARVGMPRLLDLAKDKRARLTFFINPGRSISLSQSVKAAVFKKPMAAQSAPAQLSARRKLGNVEFLRCALINPKVLAYGRSAVLRAYREGHEVGLHGGHNHELWGRFVDQWSDDQIKEEMEWGLERLKAVGITPTAFASPCAAGGDRVRLIAGQYFRYISDDLQPGVAPPRAV